MHWIGMLLALAGGVPVAMGNVCVEEELLCVPGPACEGRGTWRALDHCLDEAGEGTWDAGDEQIVVGKLPVGWYRVDFLNEDSEMVRFTTAAVLAPLVATPPTNSPVAMDVAMSWVPEDDPSVWRLTGQLARMAGIRMVRDRLRWREVQPDGEDPFPRDTVYDQTADIQKEAELQILQVFHDSPSWTWKEGKGRGRIPGDLRDTWQFCREASSHFRGRVQAWESWNEGNVRNFGGHTLDELCSHQKAMYWGVRAGNPEAQVCWGPMAGVHTEGHHKGMTANGVQPYFDIFTYHTYDWCHDYPKLREWVLPCAGGKPLWVTECDRGIAPDPDSPLGDLTPEMERLKAEFITQSIASSLAAGAERHFHFILSQYLEGNGKVQFGLLRHDNTPRMGYVALAAAGRFLAGASYLGRAGDPSQEDIYVFAFRAQPDGEERDVLVAWTEGKLDWPDRGHAVAEWTLDLAAETDGVWDFMGRSLGKAIPTELTSRPIYIVLPAGATDSLDLVTPPALSPEKETIPSPVVLQLYAPDMPLRERTHNWSHEYDRTIVPGENAMEVVSYHFGEAAVSGKITVPDLPPNWRCVPESWPLSLNPMERHVQRVVFHLPASGPSEPEGEWVRLEGDFGPAGKTHLGFRVMPEE